MVRSALETSPHMQLGSLTRWLKKDAPAWEGELFTAATIGRGRDVVLLHGLAASPDTWDEAPEWLGDGVKLHLPHMRGFAGLGPSAFRDPMNFLKPMADALAGYIRLNIGKPVPVVGHSMGGIVALILARDHADVVERLMVVDVPAFFSVLISPFATPTSMAAIAQHSRRSYFEKTKPQLTDELRRATAKLVTSPQQIERIVRWGLASDRRTTADVMAEVMVTDLRGDLQRIKAPVDVIYAWDKSGHNGRIGLDQTYAAAYSGLAQGHKLRIDDARHYVMIDQPAAFYGAVNTWLAR
jgi:pimeloyl-ACP methyl ester carboxylesterase